MVDIKAIKTAVKLTIMSCLEVCRCCYSSEGLIELCGPALDVYLIIYNIQGINNGNIRIFTCLQCRKFLEEVHRFRIDDYPTFELFYNDSGVVPHKENLSQIDIKTEIDQNSVQISKVEVDFYPENLQEISGRNNDWLHKSDGSSELYHSGNYHTEGIGRKDLLSAHIKNHSHVKPYKCSECSYTATKSDALDKHFARKHSNEGPFSCDQCNNSYKFKYELDEHEKTHLKDCVEPHKCSEYSFTTKPFCCDHCGFRAKTKHSIYNHMKIHLNESDKPYKCSECSYSTINKGILSNHIAYKHRDEKPFSCDQCDYHCKIKSQLGAHKRTHLKDHERPYKCTECSYTTITKKILDNHVLCKHRGEKPFSCDQCDYHCKLRSQLVAHKRTHLREPDRPYKCNECSYTTIKLVNLRNHIACKHNNDKPFSCDQCDFRANTKYYMTIHMKNHINDADKPYKCSECSYASITERCLIAHILRKHSDEKPFACDQCDYRCKFKDKLAEHARVHLKDCDKPFKCSECSYAATSKRCLSEHVARRHSDIKPFSCDQCNFQCKIKKVFNNHIRKHSIDFGKRYECSECSYKTTTVTYLKIHVASKHSVEKAFPCDQCDYRSNRRDQLKIHMRKHLGDDENPYKCNECSYKTTTMRYLNNHIACKHRDEKPFSCDQCDYHCKTKTLLGIHRKKHKVGCN